MSADPVVSGGRAFEEVARSIFDPLKALFRIESSYVVVPVDELEKPVLTFFHSEGSSCAVDGDLRMRVRGIGLSAARTKRAVFANDFGEAEAANLPAGHPPIESVLFVPLEVRGDVQGVVGFANKPGGFSEGDVRTAEAFAMSASGALKHWYSLQLVKEDLSQFRAVAEAASEPIVTVDGEGRVVYWNRAAEEMFGYLMGEMVGRPMSVIVAESLRQACQERIESYLEAGSSRLAESRMETVATTRDGQELPVEFSLSAWHGDGGVFLSAIIRDISDRKRIELLLLERQAELTAIFDHAPLLLALVDQKRRVRKANRVAATFGGGKVDQLIGSRVGEALRCLNALGNVDGCGGADGCECCRIRSLVEDSFATGRPHHQISMTIAVGAKVGGVGESETRRLLVTTSPLDIGEEPMVLFSAADVTVLEGGEGVSPAGDGPVAGPSPEAAPRDSSR